MKRANIFLVLCLLLITTGFAQITLPKLISDGAILQRDTELKIWGWASANEQVELSFLGEMYSAQSNEEGVWQILLPPQKAGGPFTMAFKGKNTITLNNILFGDVWVCSGQSNMELGMNRVKDTYPNEIENANNPFIRQFLVPDKFDFNTEHNDFESGSWKEVNQSTIQEFSAVAYFFAKELYAKYKVPIGLINSALGGSPVEAWMSEDALKEFPEAYSELLTYKDDNYVKSIQDSDRKRIDNWYKTLNQKDAGLTDDVKWSQEKVDDSDWKTMDVPGFWDDDSNDIDGVVWFRRTINIPKNMLRKEAKLWLGRIVDMDSVYVNGQFVGNTGYQYPPRKYQVDKNILKEGENTIAIRIFNERDKGGFIKDKPYFLAVDKDSINLIGQWKYKVGATAKPLQGQTFIRWKAGGLYKPMIHPLLDYKMKGVIWYQGESNTKNPDQYFKTFPALINNWRDKWNMDDFPFLYVQLANFMEPTNQPMESNWAELRQAQLETIKVPNTGMAVTIDLGEWNDIHPLNKKEVGRRLALLAFDKAYNDRDSSKSSPTPKKSKFGKNNVKICFNNKGWELISKDNNDLKYFEISNDGKDFKKAQAKLKGNKLIVWLEGLENPVAVRYAWSDNPEQVNFYSTNGLPVSPFEVRK